MRCMGEMSGRDECRDDGREMKDTDEMVQVRDDLIQADRLSR